MRVGHLLGIGLVLVCGVGIGTAEAQVCSGAGSFAQAPLQVGANLAVASGTRAIGGSFGAGNSTMFGIGSVGMQNIDGVDGNMYSVSGTIGSDQAVDANRHVYACPIGTLGYTSGPSFGTVGTSAIDAALGGSIGIMAGSSPMVAVVPTVGMFYRYERVSAGTSSVSVNASQSFGTADFGVGFVFNQRMAITPALVVPFGLDGADTSFSVSFTYNFGR